MPDAVADGLHSARTYVIIQLLQHSLVQLDDKGASVPVLQDSDLCSGPFSGHLVQGHLNAGLLACYLRDLQFDLIQFDMYNVLGGKWDPTDNRLSCPTASIPLAETRHMFDLSLHSAF